MKRFVLFILSIHLIFFSALPSYSQATCSGSTVVCANGVAPVCTIVYPIPYCDCFGFPRCISRSYYAALLNSGTDCSSFLSELPTPSCPTPQPITTIYTCDPGYTSCPDNMTAGVCCLYGCCSSDSTKCKCASNSQCSPSCTLPTQPTNPITPTCNASLLLITCMLAGASPNFVTCTCNASSNPTIPTVTPSTSSVMCAANLTACPNDITTGFLCCQYGCCPSSPSLCRCSNSDQCDPNCSAQPTAKVSLQVSNIKTSGFKLTAIGDNFNSISNCSATTVGGLKMKIKPDFFYLGASQKQVIRVTVPTAFRKFYLQSSQEITISVSCENGAEAEKSVSLSQ